MYQVYRSWHFWSSLIEVRVLSILRHPFIIHYHNSFNHDSSLMIVMEYAAGGNLQSFLQSRLPSNFLQEQHAVDLFTQMTLGLQHIHRQNILHRDLKPQNIFMDITHKYLKIGDFGISKILSSKSKAFTVVGTPCYLSPELCQNKPYNKKSDVWALGCILYELLTLKMAFQAERTLWRKPVVAAGVSAAAGRCLPPHHRSGAGEPRRHEDLHTPAHGHGQSARRYRRASSLIILPRLRISPEIFSIFMCC
ncbi:serine/threonine-protein kinase Nek8 isoform X3 [Hyalella azteca]|uniref:non-specific serine/threonine protein kinase n=1 Tax=Hyalella azteca TaxID=294128 RepID=A0A979FLN7_HYAAZ|nr:serine/threonine-protein kinase Nek8 isoform X3 [Hyalella azteca]